MLRPALFVTVLSIGIAYAQVPGTEVYPFGPIVAGNCAKWQSPNQIADAGKTCGGAVTPSDPVPILFN